VEGSIGAPIPVPEHDLPEVAELQPAEHDLTFRYCTECMLVDAELEIPELRKLLQPLGNSLVMAGSRRRMRIHIHSNDPEAVFELAGTHGRIEKTKADDMVGQARALHRGDRKIAIVTDSAADIPESVMTQLDIHMVPLRVQFGEHSFLDKTGMSPTEFRAELASNPNQPGTSQPTQGDFRRMFEFLGTHFEQVTSINLGSQLSGTYQGANNAASRSDSSGSIEIIDSANVSVGQGLLVARAAELAAEGLQGDALRKQINAEKTRIRTFALVTDLSNAVRSGRVAPTLKILANGLRITPVLTNTRSGKIGVCGYIPGRFRLVQRFIKLAVRELSRDTHWTLAIAHGPEQADNAALLIEELKQYNDRIEIAWQTDIGPALGVHAGMNALVIAVRESESG
jgi:DegV family protein with EDD domain